MKRNSKQSWIALFICAIFLSLCAVGMYAFLKTKTKLLYKAYSNEFVVGDIANSTIVAETSFDIIDEEATAQAKEQAMQAVLPVFSYSFEETLASIEGMEVLSKTLSSPEVSAAAFEMLEDVLNKGYISYVDLYEAEAEGYTEIMLSSDSSIVKIEDALSEKTLRNYLRQDTKAYYSALTALERIEATEAVVTVIRTNFSYDELLTSVKRQIAGDSVEPVKISVKKNQVLIEKDTVIEKEQYDLLLLVSSQNKISIAVVLGLFAFCLVCFTIELNVFSYVVSPSDRHYLQYLLIMTASCSLAFAFAYFSISLSLKLPGNFIHVYMPSVFVPVLMTMITGKKGSGFLSSFIVGTGMLLVPGADWHVFFYCIISGMTAVFLVKILHKRSDSVLQWFLSTASSCIVSLLFLILSSGSFNYVFVNLAVCATVISIAYLLIAITLPVIEKVCNLPTVFRLHELSYGESKLVATLARIAPGTYNHSKNVAYLADSACQAIGANGLLARVGSIYHDVGKIEHPEYFVENQTGNNKPKDINPTLYATIIKNHVKVGAEKARAAGLPVEVVDIVANHHGNDVIKFFFNEAKNDYEITKNQEIQASDFSYNAEIPSSKECAVVMLADSVEAAARTVNAPTATKFSKLIESIIFKKIEHGQLDNSGLTFNDIKLISESFLKTLSAQYHSRIEYPDEEKNEQHSN